MIFVNRWVCILDSVKWVEGARVEGGEEQLCLTGKTEVLWLRHPREMITHNALALERKTNVLVSVSETIFYK